MRLHANKMKILTLMITVTLGGCQLAPEYQRPDSELPVQFSRISEQQPDAVPALNEPVLAQLIEKALDKNRDLAIAATSIEQALVALGVRQGATLPDLDLNAGARRSRRTDYGAVAILGDPVTNNFQSGLSSSYLIDWWGRNQQAINMAEAEVKVAELGLSNARRLIKQLVATHYFSLRSVDQQLAVTKGTIESYHATLQLMATRVDNGLASELEYYVVEEALEATKTRMFSLQEQRSMAENQLALLLADNSFSLAAKPGYTISLPKAPNPGLPADLLLNRADIQAAEYRLKQANANIGLAKAALYPSIYLTGSLGQESADLSDLLKSGARIWNLGIGLDLPIFDGNERTAAVKAATLNQQQAIQGYQQTVANAFLDVSNALSQWQLRSEAMPHYQARLDAAMRALKLAKSRYELGYSSYLELLETQRNVDSAQLALIQQQELRAMAWIGLVTALSGDM